ncbi:MAG: hypothetical protein KIS76_06425 [Pyrinomonadaceae bacterium]|nr:hypothetical protein [Pyrinomonadaceae bacterium]
MKNWFTSLIFLVSLIVSVPAGTMYSDRSMNPSVCPMKCCKKKSAKSEEPKANDVAICRTINCSTPTPTGSNSSSQMSFTPNLIPSESISLFDQIFTIRTKDDSQPVLRSVSTLNSVQPKYIRHLSLLI